MFETDTSKYYKKFRYTKIELLLTRLDSARNLGHISDKTHHLFKLYFDVAMEGLKRESSRIIYVSRIAQLVRLIDIKMYELLMFRNGHRSEAVEWEFIIKEIDDIFINEKLKGDL